MPVSLLVQLSEARDFLLNIDPDTDKHHFQTFDDVRIDGKKRENPKLTHAIHGSLDELAKQLKALNEKGAGVYVTINETDGEHRRDANIIASRGVWGDFDKGIDLNVLPLPPSLVTQTSTTGEIVKRQCLWLTDKNALSREEIVGVLNHIAIQYGGDPGARKYCQVLRLPGFYHMKDPDNAQLVKFATFALDEDECTRVYSREEILAAFPPLSVKISNEADFELRDVPLIELDQPAAIAEARRYLASAPPAITGDNGDNTTFLTACWCRDLGVTAQTAVELMMEPGGWWSRCASDAGEEWLEAKVDNAYRYPQNRPGCKSILYEMAEVISEEPNDLIGESSTATRAKPKWPVLIGKEGRERPDPSALKNVECFLDYMNLKVAYNTFSGERTIAGLRHYKVLNDDAYNNVWAMANAVGLRSSIDPFIRLIQVASESNRFHPIIDWLESVEWDGKARVNDWLTTYCGAVASDLHREFGRVFLIGAAKRILKPGCKFDYMLVLEGAQGVGKSTVASILGGDWFGDSLRLGSDARETIERTRGRWIVELPELSGIQRNEVEPIKQQITTQTDRARPAYGRTLLEVPRQFVMFGTTNDSRYLKDRDGNRRFLPVQVGQRIDLKALTRDRAQLLVEAYQRAKAGESTVLSNHVLADAQRAQADRVEVDSIKETLTELLDGKIGRVVKEDLWLALGRPHAATRTQREMNSLTSTMRDLAWTAARHRHPAFGLKHCFEKGLTGKWLELNNGELKEFTGDVIPFAKLSD